MSNSQRAIGPDEAGSALGGGLDALQGLRAAAALLVVVDHAILLAPFGMGAAWREHAFILGLTGVRVFFVISGFVMVLSHYDDFAAPGAPRRFLARRIARILPLYWIATLLAAAVDGKPNSAGSILLSMLLIPHQETGQPFGWPLHPVGWTLQFELFFYLLFAAALMLKPPQGLTLLGCVLAIIVAGRQAGLLGGENVLSYFGRPVILCFLGGIALALARPRLPERWRLRFWPALGVACVALAVGSGHSIAASGQGLPGSAFAAAAILLAVAACALTRQTTALASAQQLARRLGDATYSIYLLHPFIVFGAAAATERIVPDLPLPLFIALAAALSAAAGMLAYRVIERPLVRGCGSLLGQEPAVGGRRFGGRRRDAFSRGAFQRMASLCRAARSAREARRYRGEDA